MPFKSKKQRSLMWAKYPDIARKWTEKYGSEVVKTAKSIYNSKKK